MPMSANRKGASHGLAALIAIPSIRRKPKEQDHGLQALSVTASNRPARGGKRALAPLKRVSLGSRAPVRENPLPEGWQSG
jgi:hypothetical protein